MYSFVQFRHPLMGNWSGRAAVYLHRCRPTPDWQVGFHDKKAVRYVTIEHRNNEVSPFRHVGACAVQGDGVVGREG